jgi:23S rRNA pseudouridine2605 synthase
MVRERVQKILATAGVDSRRKCEVLIDEGRVTVNGKRIKLGDSADSQIDSVEVDGHKVETRVKFVYLMFNKPTNYITTVSDMFERRTVMDLLPEKYMEARVFPVGRLDRDAEGLLLFTNDGEFANKIMHPRYTITKTYRVWLDHQLDPVSIRTLQSGVKLEDGWVKDIKIVHIDKICFELTLHVGKHKVVKRIFDHLGYRVTRLIRVRIGSLSLGSLKSGQVMELDKPLLDKIFENPAAMRKVSKPTSSKK